MPKLYSPIDAISEIRYLELSKGPHHSVSLTGGEPLLHSEFLKVFLKNLKREGLKAYLETNGTLPRALAEIIDLVDIIAMDFKLPSSTGEEDLWNKHKEFLAIAVKAKVFVKAIITSETSKKDVEKAMSIMQKFKNVAFILQPATSKDVNDKSVSSDRLLKFLDLGSKHKLENIRVIPQVHKILNVK
jgi:organic radical activating enzyme